VEGGPTRTASVRAALDHVPTDAAIIVLHDAAHPLATPSLFGAVIAAVQAGAPAAVPGVRPSEVVRRVRDDRVVDDVGRDDLVLVQLPGAFRGDVLRAAHATGREAVEDSQLVAALGHAVAVVPGEPRNLHVVTTDDLELVRCLAREQPGRAKA
jgi:2-C-methyl-D-erythritol 4-phosphate cytidylyltransferase